MIKQSTISHIPALTGLFALLAGVTPAPPARAEMQLSATAAAEAPRVDGDASDWSAVDGLTVPLEGKGNVASVELKAAIHGDSIYILAVWDDKTKSDLHKPYKWDEALFAYGRTKQLEDRFAIQFAMEGDFSHDKTDGSTFKADVWHWKASRSNPVGLAHDKWLIAGSEPMERSKKVKGADGKTAYIRRIGDAGDKLYSSVTYDVKDKDIMPRYKVTEAPRGSIADIQAKGVWADGRWTLEMTRKLDTGNADDAVIPASGSIQIAVAAFNDVDGKNHSVSQVITLNTGG